MAYDLDVGGGSTVRVHEPERANFPENLGGAVEFTITHFVYSTLEFMGGAMGSWLAGVLVKFLDSVEPALVEHVAPLLDMLLEIEELPDHLKDFFTQLKTPTSAAGATILAGLAATAGGTVAGGVIGSLSALWTYPINRQMRFGRPSITDSIAMQWRGIITPAQVSAWGADLGYPDLAQDAYREILRPRLDPASLMQCIHRGTLSPLTVMNELGARGYTTPDINLMQNLSYGRLPPATLINAVLRGEIPRSLAETDIKAQGWRDQDVDLLFRLAQVIPPVPDLISMAVREVFTPEIAERFGQFEDLPTPFVEWAARVGMSAEWAKRYWGAHWRLPTSIQAFEMYHRGVIDHSDLQLLLRALDIMPYWRDKLLQIAYKPYTRVDTRRMYGLGVLDRDEVKRAYLDLGYDEVKAEAMTEFTVRYEDEGGANNLARYRSMSQSLVTKAYELGKISEAEATTRLLDLGYDIETSNLLLALLDAEKEISETPQMLGEFRRDMRAIIERGYERKTISPETALSMLVDLGFGENEAEYMLLAVNAAYQQKSTERILSIIGRAYILRAITPTRTYELLGQLNLPAPQQSQVMAEWDVERNIRDRRLTESQYRKAYNSKIIDLDEYAESLRGLGYTERDIEILVALMTGGEE